MRIASLIPAATEILFGLGAGDDVCAVSHECDWPPNAAELPRATYSNVDSSRPGGEIDQRVKTLLARGEPLYGLDEALLASLAPDVIVTQAQCDVCAVRYQDVCSLAQRYPALGAARVIALGPASWDDVLADIARVGGAIDRTASASRWIAELRRRVECVRSRTAEIPHDARPRVVCLEWLEPLMAAGNWMPELVEWAGGRSGLSRPGEHSGYVTWEELAAYDPECLVVMPCGFDLRRSLAEAEALLRHPQWCGLSAVRAKRVYAVDANAHFNRPGPRLADSLELLARLIHPNLFDDPMPDAPPALHGSTVDGAWSPVG